MLILRSFKACLHPWIVWCFNSLLICRLELHKDWSSGQPELPEKVGIWCHYWENRSVFRIDLQIFDFASYYMYMQVSLICYKVIFMIILAVNEHSVFILQFFIDYCTCWNHPPGVQTTWKSWWRKRWPDWTSLWVISPLTLLFNV